MKLNSNTKLIYIKNWEAYSPESNERNIKYTVSDEKKVFKKENGQKKLNKKIYILV